MVSDTTRCVHCDEIVYIDDAYCPHCDLAIRCEPCKVNKKFNIQLTSRELVQIDQALQGHVHFVAENMREELGILRDNLVAQQIESVTK